MYVARKEGREGGNSQLQVVAQGPKENKSVCACVLCREKERVLTGHWRGEECPALAQENGMEGGVCSHCCCQLSAFPLQSHGDFLTYRFQSSSYTLEISHKALTVVYFFTASKQTSGDVQIICI